MKLSFTFLVVGMLLASGCKSRGFLGKIDCPGAHENETRFVEVYYQYGFLKQVAREEMEPDELQRLDSLFSFTTMISGHEGWAVNAEMKYNSYYHPEYFVLENPHEFEGKPRNDHDFSMYCPNALSEMIRLYVHNDLNTDLKQLEVSVRPAQYIYNKRTKHYQPLLEIVAADSTFFQEVAEQD